MLTVKQAAVMLGITDVRVRKLISDGILPAEKFGNTWSLSEQAVTDRIAAKPHNGRPRKDASVKAPGSQKDFSRQRNLYRECKKISRLSPVWTCLCRPRAEKSRNI